MLKYQFFRVLYCGYLLLILEHFCLKAVDRILTFSLLAATLILRAREMSIKITDWIWGMMRSLKHRIIPLRERSIVCQRGNTDAWIALNEIYSLFKS